jgi:surfactin synthase thioesterase subunit
VRMGPDHARDAERRRWLLYDPAPESAARLFCLPYSGCGAGIYRSWPQYVGAVEVCPVQPPGRETRMREPTFASYEALADGLIDALEPYLDRPFALFGHCGSALPCYEAAVRLAARGGPVPARLFVSSQVAPHHGPRGRFLRMSDAELAGELESLIRHMGGTVVPDLLDLYLEVLRGDVDANRRYRPAAPVRLPCPITAIGWEDDREVAHGEMGGWSDCGETTFRTFPGDHYRFLRAPAELLAAIREDMDAAVLEEV